MKHLKSYKEIKEICEKYEIENWSISKDGLVDVDGKVDLGFKNLEKLPLNFGRIRGNFHCYNNNLTSLEGVPKKVGGAFSCFNNDLTSLEGAPKKVSDDFECFNNELTTLEGAPKEVSGNFDCGGNKLITLEGASKKVGGDFYCRDNNLINLEGIPFDIKYLDCYGNPIYEIWKFIDNVEYLQEFVEVYDVVRPGKVVILEYLNDIRKLMGKEPVRRRKISLSWKILNI